MIFAALLVKCKSTDEYLTTTRASNGSDNHAMSVITTRADSESDSHTTTHRRRNQHQHGNWIILMLLIDQFISWAEEHPIRDVEPSYSAHLANLDRRPIPAAHLQPVLREWNKKQKLNRKRIDLILIAAKKTCVYAHIFPKENKTMHYVKFTKVLTKMGNMWVNKILTNCLFPN